MHLNGEKKGCGEVRAQNQYLVAPGTEIQYVDLETKETKNGRYTITNDVPIATLDSSDFMKLLTPYLGSNPDQRLTQEEIEKGVDEGTRHDRSIKYACHLIEGAKLDYETALFEIERWDKLNRPPINNHEYFERTIKKAIEYSDQKNKVFEPFKTVNPKGLPKDETQKIDYQRYMRLGKNGNIDFLMKNILEDLQKQFTFKTPTDTEDIYVYENGAYIVGEHRVKTLLEKWLGEETTSHVVNEILDHIRRSSFIDRYEFNKFEGIIPVQNGLLDLKSLTLKPFDKNQIFTYKIAVSFDQSKDCPKFKKWLAEVLAEEDIPTLQEYSGYCLLPAMPFHRSMWFYGIGRNGKGTFIKTLEAVLGKNNCAYISIQAFDGARNFSESQLWGKLINVSSEPQADRELQTPLFKKLTGDDYLDAEIKCVQRRISFRSFAKFFILGNRYPQVNDDTIAFWERVLLLPWTNIFLEGKNQIQHIEKTWLSDPDEVSGILNWMLEGLQRLLENEAFTVTKSQRETIIEFQKASDPPAAWLSERCEFDVKGSILKTDAYEDYKNYCDENGLSPNNVKFYAKMRNTPKIRETQQTIDKKRQRCYNGVKLKPLPDIIQPAQGTQPAQGLDILQSLENTLYKGSKETPVQPVHPVQGPTTCKFCHGYLPEGAFTIVDGQVCCFPCEYKLKEGKKEVKEF